MEIIGQDIVSPHFRYSEFVVSDKFPELAKKIRLRGLDSVKIHYLVWMILEPVRVLYEPKWRILSGIRSEVLNEAVGGAECSDHLYLDHAGACDFTVMHEDRAISETMVHVVWTEMQKCSFGQLIYYGPEHGNFVHVSLPTRKHQNEVMVKIAGGYQHIK